MEDPSPYIQELNQISFIQLETFMKQEGIRRKGGSTRRQSVWSIEKKAFAEKDWFERVLKVFIENEAHRVVHRESNSIVHDVDKIRELASQGNADASNTLGDLYRVGRMGIEYDLETAISWYSAAAMQGHTDAIYNLALCYDLLNPSSDIVNEEGGKAEPWLKKAADAGISDAAYKLGWSYKNRNGGQSGDMGAIYWYTKAAAAGHPYAQYNLGLCFKNGTGVKQDYAEAVRWIKKAAEQNDPDAQHSLGLRYKCGEGVTQDYLEAFRWFKKAAGQGYGYSQYHLGSLYKRGRGAPIDYEQSFKYYKLAADQGDTDAIKKLRKFNIDPLYTEVISTLWPKTHPKLHKNCQNAILELYCYNKKERDSNPVHRELLQIIAMFIIKYWPTKKDGNPDSPGDTHTPYYLEPVRE